MDLANKTEFLMMWAKLSDKARHQVEKFQGVLTPDDPILREDKGIYAAVSLIQVMETQAKLFKKEKEDNLKTCRSLALDYLLLNLLEVLRLEGIKREFLPAHTPNPFFSALNETEKIDSEIKAELDLDLYQVDTDTDVPPEMPLSTRLAVRFVAGIVAKLEGLSVLFKKLQKDEEHPMNEILIEHIDKLKLDTMWITDQIIGGPPTTSEEVSAIADVAERACTEQWSKQRIENALQTIHDKYRDIEKRARGKEGNGH